MLKKERKTLTRDEYTLLFRRLGESPRPLSSYQIKNEMYESKGRYIYEMIHKLVPSQFDDDYGPALFIWDKAPEKKEKYNLVRILNDFFDLGWMIDFNYNEEALTFNKTHDDKVMTIENADSNIIIEIERDIYPEYKHLATMRIITKGYGEKEVTCIIKKHGNDEIITLPSSIYRLVSPNISYLDRYYRSHIDYLDHTLDAKSEYIHSIKFAEHAAAHQRMYLVQSEFFKSHKIDPSKPPTDDDDFNAFNLTMKNLFEKQEKLRKEMSNIMADRRKWVYSLNIRGFIKYILGEIKSETKDHGKSNKKKGNTEKKGRIHNKRISNVLENLSANYSEEFPFLTYYREFRNEYDKLRIRAKFPMYYEVELLKSIAQELQFQVDNANMDFLKYWITRRYSGELTYYFIAALSSRLLDDTKDLHRLSLLKIRDYQSRCLNLMRQYLESEHNNIQVLYENTLTDNYELPDIYL